MNTEPIANRCPKCQAPLPANAPRGLCPKCLLAAVSTPTEAGQPADKNPPPPIGSVAAAFPQLEILELIGQGGMGVVYKARQPHLDRLVALKLLPQSLAADAAFAERFNREARVLARLNHPNIVTVHDFGQSGGFFYLLMEFVDGVNLRQAMQAGRFTPQQAMLLVPKICEALQFAHDEGILHRDIKPENILLDTRGRVKIADFGIAKLVGEAKEKVTLTASGQAVGTPHYMAPEQLEHPQDVDQRADIYSLGVVFYEMLTGELPIGRFAPPSSKTTVDPRVDEVVFHALEKEREKRFRSAGEVKTSVEAITSTPALPDVTRPVPAAAPVPSEPSRPLGWTISAWAFLIIGIMAVVDTLASFYSRPLNITVSPAIAHLFAGVALLTLSRAWRRVAFVTLGLASAAGLFIGIGLAASPGHGWIDVPAADLKIPLQHEPRMGAIGVVLLALGFAWPWYMLLSATGRRLFARAPGPDTVPGHPTGPRVTCYFNTPARMRDCFPSAAPRIFTCRGELQLDGENLTFTSPWRTTITIPLKEIEDLSIGQFQMWTTPWVMKYARISFLSVSFRQQGQLQTVHLTPVDPGPTTAAQINDCVGHWFERVRQAASRATGNLPHTSDTASVSVSAEPVWNRRVLPLVLGCLLIGIGTWVLQARMVQGPIWLVALVIVMLLMTGLCWFSLSFLLANSALGRGQLDAVTSDDPPAPEPASAAAGGGVHPLQAARWAKTSFLTIGIFALAVILLLTCLSYKNRHGSAFGERRAGRLPSAVSASHPEAETKLVLYMMGTPVNAEPAVVRCHCKCLIPAHHLARVLFIRWANGVPEINNTLSGYFKVGNAPIEQDFALGCSPLAPKDSAAPTNTVRWAVNLFGRAATTADFPAPGFYRRLTTLPRMTVRPGHQGILRLAECVAPDGQPARDRSSFELRVFLEPIKYAPVRVDPFEIEGTNYVAGTGPGWTTDQALEAIKEWPVDQ